MNENDVIELVELAIHLSNLGQLMMMIFMSGWMETYNLS